MTTATRKALADIRAYLGVKRIDPRRLYLVDDGAYRWIGDRDDLSTADARMLHAITNHVSDPSRYPADGIDPDEYSETCGRCPCIAASHGAAGIVDWDDLPEDWRDGSALGPISPL